MKKSILLYGCLFLLIADSISQEISERSKKQEVSRLYGKVVDAKSKKGVEAASIQLFVYYRDANTTRDSLSGGMLSRPNGDFSIENLPECDSMRLEISAIGYRDYRQVLIPGKKEFAKKILVISYWKLIQNI